MHLLLKDKEVAGSHNGFVEKCSSVKGVVCIKQSVRLYSNLIGARLVLRLCSQYII